ncbi:hypothetical protein ACFRDV_32805 [Streptomyces fagopyri]|uniref:hypothetical protein n=1 Tax=Streptomyces fagopyri TaxID=2662397 RepID=UPI003680772A
MTEVRTAFVVVHRVSQTATADTVVVMDQGRIVEQGHALQVIGGIYASLWASWAKGLR